MARLPLALGLRWSLCKFLSSCIVVYGRRKSVKPLTPLEPATEISLFIYDEACCSLPRAEVEWNFFAKGSLLFKVKEKSGFAF